MKKNNCLKSFTFFFALFFAFTCLLQPFFAIEAYADANDWLEEMIETKDPDCVKFDIKVQYQQNEARTFLDLNNKFRSGENISSNATDEKTWYFNKKNEKTYIDELQPMVYDYELEKLAMKRAAECCVYMDSDHRMPCGLGYWFDFPVYYNDGYIMGDEGECVFSIYGLTSKYFSAGHITEEFIQHVFDGFAEEEYDYKGQGHRRAMLQEENHYFAAACCISDSGYATFVLKFANENFPLASSTPVDVSNDFQFVEIESASKHIYDIYSDDINIKYGESYNIDDIVLKAEFEGHTALPNKRDAQIVPKNNLQWHSENTDIIEICNDQIITKGIGTTNIVSEFANKTISISVTVKPIDISDGKLIIENETISFNDFKLIGSSLCPDVKVVLDEKYIDSDNYTITYNTNNNSPGIATVKVFGKNVYTGTLTESYNIVCTHDYKLNKVAPTCAEGGGNYYTCSVCNDSYVTDKSNPLGHDYVLKGFEESTHHFECSRCDESYDEAHVFNNIEYYGDPCTEGIYKKTECEICSKITSNKIQEPSHDYTAILMVMPTCVERGHRVYSCKRCGDTYNEYFGSTIDHNYKLIKIIEPTCTEEGYYVYSCKTCGDTYSEEYKSALGHDYCYVNRVAPTCTNWGYLVFTCSRCGDTYHNLYGSPIDHDYCIVQIIQEPTCAQNGTAEYECSVCGDKCIKEVVSPNHNWLATQHIEASCTAPAYTIYTCQNEGCPIKTQKIVDKGSEALGHKYSIVWNNSSYGNGYIEKSYQCIRCDDNYIELVYNPNKVVVGSSTYSGTECKPSVKVLDVKGNTISSSNYTVSYSNNINSGRGNVTITFKQNSNYRLYSDMNATFTINKCGVGSASFSSSKLVYTGKNLQPKISAVYGKNGKLLKSGKDYNITYPKTSKNVGKYRVTIRGNGNYNGNKNLTFTIIPKSTSVSKLTAKSRGFAVKWKKQSTQTTGYQIQYATDSKFTKNKKTVTISSNKTTSKTISKLKAKKKYYVRVRTYKTVNGTKYYSSWSKTKTVTTKK